TLVAEFRSVNAVGGHNSFERRLDHLDGSGREDGEFEMITLDAVIENLVQQSDVVFEADALPHFVEVLPAHARLEFRVVEQQVGELRPLLHQVQFGHAGGLALELPGRNSNDFAQNVARVVEGQRLIEVAGKKIVLHKRLTHG